jgi:predicted nucleic acid-binding protein
VKILFDTSVLVPALIRQHSQHQPARSWLERGQQGEFQFVVGTHTLAELFSLLTRYPLQPRISPRNAFSLIEENVLRSATVIDLSASDYSDVLTTQTRLGNSGGSVYDALIARAAQKAEADILLTLNPRHFARVWPEGEGRIRTP